MRSERLNILLNERSFSQASSLFLFNLQGSSFARVELDLPGRQENGQCPLSLLIRRRRYGKVPMLWFSSRPSRRRCPPCGGGLIFRQPVSAVQPSAYQPKPGLYEDGSPTALCLPSNGVGSFTASKWALPRVAGGHFPIQNEIPLRSVVC